MDYSLQIGKYVHEVVEEATLEDLKYFLAIRTIEGRERDQAKRRAEFKAKASRGAR